MVAGASSLFYMKHIFDTKDHRDSENFRNISTIVINARAWGREEMNIVEVSSLIYYHGRFFFIVNTVGHIDWNLTRVTEKKIYTNTLRLKTLLRAIAIFFWH